LKQETKFVKNPILTLTLTLTLTSLFPPLSTSLYLSPLHNPTVLWDANTGVTLSVIRYHKKGVSHLMFSSSGTLLVSVGMDDDRAIAVHNSKTSALVGTGKAGRGIPCYGVFVLPL
jgi:WD40 repeat protein